VLLSLMSRTRQRPGQYAIDELSRYFETAWAAPCSGSARRGPPECPPVRRRSRGHAMELGRKKTGGGEVWVEIGAELLGRRAARRCPHGPRPSFRAPGGFPPFAPERSTKLYQRFSILPGGCGKHGGEGVPPLDRAKGPRRPEVARGAAAHACWPWKNRRSSNASRMCFLAQAGGLRIPAFTATNSISAVYSTPARTSWFGRFRRRAPPKNVV